MPNWVYNRVHGNQKAIEQLVDKEKGCVTFEKLVPTPVELSIVEKFKDHSDTHIIEALLKYVFEDNEHYLMDTYSTRKEKDPYIVWKQKILSMYPLKHLSIYKKLKDETGCVDWYNWNCTHWGCKWDGNSSDFDTYDGTEDEVQFMTPWSPPEGVIRALANKYPDLELTWHCDEESCAFSIDYIFNGDGTVSEYDVKPEYFYPYVLTKEELEDDTQGCKNLGDVKEQLHQSLPQDSYEIINETEDELTIEVTDPWGDSGSYEVVFNKDGTMCHDD